MSGRELRRCLGACAWVALAQFGFGCNFSEQAQGLEDAVTDPTPSGLVGEGVRLRTGSFSRLSTTDSEQEGRHVLAIEHRDAGDELVILPVEKDAGCRAGPVNEYVDLSSEHGLVAIRNAPEDGPDTLTLVDFACEPVFDPIDGGALPSMMLIDWDANRVRGFLMSSSDGDLILIDVLDMRLRTLASGVTVFDAVGEQIAAISEGELVFWDFAGNEVARHGSDVKEFVLGDLYPTVGAYVDEDSLYLLDSFTNEAQRVRDDVCGLTGYLSDSGSFFDYLGFLSPCASGRLTLLHQSSALGRTLDEPEFFEYSDGVVHPELVWFSDRAREENFDALTGLDLEDLYERAALPPGIVYLVSDDPEAETGTLVLDHPGQDIFEVIGEDGYLGGDGLLTDFDGESGTRWVENSLGEEPRFVQVGERSLPDFHGEYVVDFDGTTGVLLDHSHPSWGAPRVLAERVPAQRVVYTSFHRAFVANVRRGLGDLYYAPGFGVDPAVVAQGVRPSSLRPLWAPTALGYLGDPWADGAGQFRVWIPELELEVGVSFEVTEFAPMPPITPGIVYITREAGREGIWFLRPR